MLKIEWPDMTFPPVNLYTVSSVDWFYRDRTMTKSKPRTRKVDTTQVLNKFKELFNLRINHKDTP